ncbi:MAG: hypothetical protein ABSB42_13330 [Tepidisphaeraceae bacterium]|jgi:hypothetical protein
MTGGERKAQAELYRDAATERAVCARELYDGGWYVDANYLAGVAVECMLRAYRVMIDPEFDSRHDIGKLCKMAKFTDVVPPTDNDKVNAALGEVVALWSNNHRYLPSYALKDQWIKRNLHRHGRHWIKGDFVKEQTRRLINAAFFIVSVGEAQWKTSFEN